MDTHTTQGIVQTTKHENQKPKTKPKIETWCSCLVSGYNIVELWGKYPKLGVAMKVGDEMESCMIYMGKKRGPN
jgi:hypothetical protein